MADIKFVVAFEHCLKICTVLLYSSNNQIYWILRESIENYWIPKFLGMHDGILSVYMSRDYDLVSFSQQNLKMASYFSF